MSPRELARALPIGERLLCFGIGLLFWVSFVSLVLGTLAVGRVAGYPEVGAVAPTRGLDGTAVVTACRDDGPITIYGLGRAEVCTADVSTPDGDLGSVEFRVGELTRADLGRTVAVRPGKEEWVRDVDHPYSQLIWPHLGLLLMFLVQVGGLSTGVFGYMSFSSSVRFRLSSEQREFAAQRVRRHRLRRGDPAPEVDGAVIVELPQRRDENLGVLLTGGMVALVLLAVIVVGGSSYALGGSPFEFGLVHVPLVALLVAAFAFAAISRSLNRRKIQIGAVTPQMRLSETGISFDMVSGKRRTIQWRDIGRFSFVANGSLVGQGTVTAYVSFTEDGAAARWPASGQQGGLYGLIISPSMTPEDVAVLSANAERARPGMVRWPRPKVRRGGFGLVRTGRRAAAAVRRWGSPKGRGPGRRSIAPVLAEAKSVVVDPIMIRYSAMTVPRRVWVALLLLLMFVGPTIISVTDGLVNGLATGSYLGLLLLIVVHLGSSPSCAGGIPRGDLVVAPAALTWQPSAGVPVRVSFDHVRQVVVDAVPTGFAFWLGLAGRTSVRIVPAVDDFARRYPTLPERDGEFVLVETVSGGAAARLRRAVAEVRSEKKRPQRAG
ncbi:hypothetical protein CFN78_13860 [Amycolatopsis antarctica]|uniref:Uncharacterized protein n=1 Tax=Amycolatopsis antarctica TaxID=1854586 RepID=A0A263D530_9PSEU|nr:DUF6346 domain-containing protein [Amycolatopsis antarctica]OZM72707.1 hypothetical protein CFN78_13860 [Amycolatopsis antarctica]